ncbi:MAG TPA: hypothetical protein VN926_22010 [Bradyrhizobium sp.]|nr:hypothetical protein [Bradyrhizobium sp.]
MAAKKPTAARTLGVNGSTPGSHGATESRIPNSNSPAKYMLVFEDDVPQLLDFVAPC